jgi:hypothetical protein
MPPLADKAAFDQISRGEEGKDFEKKFIWKALKVFCFRPHLFTTIRIHLSCTFSHRRCHWHQVPLIVILQMSKDSEAHCIHISDEIV